MFLYVYIIIFIIHIYIYIIIYSIYYIIYVYIINISKYIYTQGYTQKYVMISIVIRYIMGCHGTVIIMGSQPAGYACHDKFYHQNWDDGWMDGVWGSRGWK